MAQIRILGEEETRKLKTDFRGFVDGGAEVLPEDGDVRYFFQGNFGKFSKQYRNFKVREDDIYVITFPRCGTTWTQEMVWLLMHNFDYEGAKEVIERRFPFIDADSHINVKSLQLPEVSAHLTWSACPEEGHRLREAENAPSPRCLKSHLPLSLMPRDVVQKSKVIYVARDPRDVVVSLFHHHSLIRAYGFSGSIQTFLEYFIRDRVIDAPIWAHIREAWDLRDHPNMLFLTFEDMKKNLPSNINKVASFLGKPISESQMTELCQHLSFESMKVNPAVNGAGDIACGFMDNSKESFIRKGISGGWREAFTENQKEILQDWFVKESKGLHEKLGWTL